MAHHAYFVAGEREAGLAAARAFVERELGLSGTSNPDIVALSFGLLSVDDARRLIGAASISSSSGTKAVIASATRLFHEAQNALLKVLEEPPAGVTIILAVPSEGMLIPTLRSRLLPLPDARGEGARADASQPAGLAAEFLAASPGEREKLAAKLVERAKADRDEVKQEARREAIELLQGITRAAYRWLHAAKGETERAEARTLLHEVSAFTPILYERSAPLKLILEHLLLVIPTRLGKAGV